MLRTAVTIYFNDPSASVRRVEVNASEMDLIEDVRRWMNGDYADGVNDAMTFMGPGTGFLVVHRSQVARVEIGDVDLPPPPVISAIPPLRPRPKRWYQFL